MAMEQVNITDLQRLNDAIAVTMDCIRRVTPQLAQLHQQVGVPGLSAGVGNLFGSVPWAQQSPFGQLSQQLPFGQPSGYGQQLGQLPFGQQHLAGLSQYGVPAIDPTTAAYLQAQAHLLRSIYGQQMGVGGVGGQQLQYAPWQQITPFVGLPQRLF